MSELRTDFKDEILQEGEEHRIYNIKRKDTNEEVESKIYLEKAYTPLQEGDNFGAKEVNEIHCRLNGLAPQNLLVNGDFHCWQRGEKFTFPGNETYERGYTADMWYMYCNHFDISDTHNITIKKINGNFVIINNLDSPFHFSMAQKHKISKSDLRDGKITISFKMKAAVEQDLNFALEFLSGPTDSLVIGKEYTVTNEWKTYTFDFDVMDYIDNMIQLNIWINTSDITVAGNQTIEIEYCRWDHGDIVFPHIPEDEAIASYRCKRYIQWLKIPQRKTYYSANFHSGENFEVEMIDRPTVIYSDVRNATSGVVEGTVFENITKRGIGILLVKEEIISAEILVSCEPL